MCTPPPSLASLRFIHPWTSSSDQTAKSKTKPADGSMPTATPSSMIRPSRPSTVNPPRWASSARSNDGDGHLGVADGPGAARAAPCVNMGENLPTGSDRPRKKIETNSKLCLPARCASPIGPTVEPV